MSGTILPGSRVNVFDPLLYINDVKTPLSHTVRPATVVCRYGKYSMNARYRYPDLVDVKFDHRPRISHGHFTDCVEKIYV